MNTTNNNNKTLQQTSRIKKKMDSIRERISKLEEEKTKLESEYANIIAFQHNIQLGKRYKVVSSRTMKPVEAVIRGYGWVSYDSSNNPRIIVYCTVYNKNNRVRQEQFYVGSVEHSPEFTLIEDVVEDKE